MKAVQINSYGGVDVLAINDNVQKPSLENNQILVEVHAASINPIDWKVREGYLKEYVPLQFPTTLGLDFSGIVREIGPSADGSASDFRVNDEVYGQGGVLNGGSGSFAEFLAANVTKVAIKPKSIDHTQAAALPLAGMSAIQALENHIKLKPKQKILIHGGAGGIGSFTIQIAKVLGAYAATTVSSKDKEYAKKLGADEVIDYTTEAFEKKLKDFDAIFDTVGGETTNKSFEILKKGGILVSMVGQPDKDLAEKYGVTAISQNTNGNRDLLHRLTELIESGKIIVHIDKVFPLNEIKEAFQYQEKNHPRGKVVLKIRD